MQGNIQETIIRRKPSRVTITYTVDTGGAQKKIELPVCGAVVSDLGASNYQDKFQDRKIIMIDRDNFSDVMSKLSPKIRVSINNVITGNPDENLVLDLQFKTMDDFKPHNVLKQNTVTNVLVEARRKLKTLLSRIDGNTDLEGALSGVLSDRVKMEEAQKLIQEGKAK